MTLQNRMRIAKKLIAIDPKSQDPRVLEMKDRIATARKEAAAKRNRTVQTNSDPATQDKDKEAKK